MASLMVGPTPYELTDIPIEPDEIGWGISDISDADSGRVQDANCTMEKRRIARKRKLSLSWANPSLQQASAVLQAFAPQYVYVRYLDVEDGAFETRQFYTGDKSSPFRQITLKGPSDLTATLSALSFDIIER